MEQMSWKDLLMYKVEKVCPSGAPVGRVSSSGWYLMPGVGSQSGLLLRQH